ncbi:SGNH/GDSL hydrolase family protein [Geodermatophilus sp. SYSU D01036]
MPRPLVSSRSAERPGRSRRRLVTTLAGALIVTASAPAVATADPDTPPASGRGHDSTWVGTWASVPTAVPATGVTTFQDQTVRQVVHTSIAGERVRLRLTNEFGDQPLHVGEVRVALRAAGATDTDIDPASDRAVTFGGRTSVTIPAGAPAVSDPVELDLPARADLVVSLYLPETTPVTTLHNFAYQANAVADGNVADDASVTPTAEPGQWFFLSGVSVGTGDHDAGAVVALGDSITNGFETQVGANHRWPDLLADRLQDQRDLQDVGVLNLGVAGNRLLHDPNPPAGHPAEAYAAYFGESALRRFDRDVLAQPGAEHVVVLLGVNDLGHPGTSAPESETVTAEEVIGAHRQLIARAHEQGLEVYGATILPFRGDTLGFWSEENEAKRRAVNDWIRTSGEYDAVIDLDAALRDPADPLRLLPAYDSGDHLHPNDAGMAAIARAIPLQLFR